MTGNGMCFRNGEGDMTVLGSVVDLSGHHITQNLILIWDHGTVETF